MTDLNFSEINLEKGLSQDLWKSFALSLKNSLDPKAWILSAKSQQPELADRALESGFSEFASVLVCSSDLLQIKALILSGQKASALSLFATVQDISEKTFCEILLQRTQSQNLNVFEKYHLNIENLILSLTDKLQLEARMQWALVLYGLEKWESVLLHYKLVFDLAEKNKNFGLKSVCAFNIATVYENLNQKIEAKTWIWMCQSNLNQYRLDNLKTSVDLYEIQCLLKNEDFEEVIVKANLFLKQENLNPVQKIRALHALSEAQMESGFIFESEMTLSQTRQFIQKSRYEQFNKEQEVIELNLASIIHRPSHFQNKNGIERYSLLIEHKAAQARWAFKMNDMARTLKLTLELKKLNASAESFEDLFVLLTNRLEQPGKKARTLEHQILKCWLSKQWKAMEYIKIFLEIEKSDQPWKKSLFHLVSGALAYLQNEKNVAMAEWHTSVELTRVHGLERLESLLCGLLGNVSPRHDLCPQEIAFYESLIAKVISSPYMISRNEKGQFNADIEKSDLIFDENKNEIIWQEKSISFQNQPLLKRILTTFFDRPQGLSKEDLIKSAWGLEYHPLHHDSMIYSAISRLRDLVPIEMEEGLYRLPKGIRWTYISDKKEKSFILSARQKQILGIIENLDNLTRKDVVESLKVSERTALRELTQLVHMGLLVQSGAGRGVHYLKWNQGA